MTARDLKIFIVDDDEMLSMMLSDHLSRQNHFQITEFSTGEECLEHIHEMPDVVILDFNLNSVVPDALNGVEIMRMIKSLEPEILTVLHSSEAEYTQAREALKIGALACVMKDQHAFEKLEALLMSVSEGNSSQDA